MNWIYWMCVMRMNGKRDIYGEPGVFPITLSSSTLKNWMTHDPWACCVPAVNVVRSPVPSFKDMVLRSCSMWRVVWMPGKRRDLRRCQVPTSRKGDGLVATDVPALLL